jgi:hypothetical protein
MSTPVKELRESLLHIQKVMEARDKVIAAAKNVTETSERSHRIYWTRGDRALQVAVNELKELEKKS